MPTRFIFDERFVEAFAHAPHRVLGRRLRPFSSWHEFNLQLINSPILTGEPRTIADLAAAVHICATRYESGGAVPELVERGWWRRLRWWWRMCRADFEAENAAFNQYLDDYYSPPKLWGNEHKQSADQLDAAERDREFDQILETVAHVWRETHCAEAEAWNMSLGALRWYSAIFSKWASGSKDRLIWTPADEQAFRAHKVKKEKEIQALAEEFCAKEGCNPAEGRAKAEADYKRRVDAFWASQKNAAPSGNKVAMEKAGKAAEAEAARRRARAADKASTSDGR